MYEGEAQVQTGERQHVTQEMHPVDRMAKALPELCKALQTIRDKDAPVDTDMLFQLVPAENHTHLRHAIWILADHSDWMLETQINPKGIAKICIVNRPIS